MQNAELGKREEGRGEYRAKGLRPRAEGRSGQKKVTPSAHEKLKIEN